MCGRFSFAAMDEMIKERFGVRVRTAIYKARYNCSPTQDLAVISNENPCELEFFRWGLIPCWSKEPAIGNRMINARSETVTEKPSFSNAFRKRRCLVPADSFYEWKKNGKKVPYRILMKDESLFAMAGLWDQWVTPEGDILRTFTILTTVPNSLLAGIHDRMPVILSPEDEKRWLAPLPEGDLLLMLQPFPEERMKAYPIPDLVNSARNEGKELWQLRKE